MTARPAPPVRRGFDHSPVSESGLDLCERLIEGNAIRCACGNAFHPTLDLTGPSLSLFRGIALVRTLETGEQLRGHLRSLLLGQGEPISQDRRCVGSHANIVPARPQPPFATVLASSRGMTR